MSTIQEQLLLQLPRLINCWPHTVKANAGQARINHRGIVDTIEWVQVNLKKWPKHVVTHLETSC